MSPARIPIDQLPAAMRRRYAGQAAPAPRRQPASATDRRAMGGRWFCLTCGLHSRSEAAALRHADSTRHYRYTDLGLGL
jgi:hypothetical protein